MLAALGIGLVIYGVIKKFEKHLNTGQMIARDPQAQPAASASPATAPRASRTPSPACWSWSPRSTTTRRRPAASTRALHTLRDQPYGPFLLTLVALGIAAFGVYCFVQSKYRKV